MKNFIDQIHRDRKLIQTLYMDGVLWDDLLAHFASRYTRSEIMGFVAGQTRQHPTGCERSVNELLHLYMLVNDPLVELHVTDQGPKTAPPTQLFEDGPERQMHVG